MPKRASEVSTNTKDPQQGGASNSSSRPEAASMPAGSYTVDPIYIGPPMSKLFMMKMEAGLYGNRGQADMFRTRNPSQATSEEQPDFIPESDSSVNARRVAEPSETTRDRSDSVEPPEKMQELVANLRTSASPLVQTFVTAYEEYCRIFGRPQ